jgi:DNA-binding MarR family transcriptional regulator
MFASEIASELDRSYQLVGKRGKMLAQRGLVKRDANEEGRRTFEITPLATGSYFSDLQNVGLDVPLEPADP